MSNLEQHKIDEKPVGSLFRRMTLASLGLDKLEDVSKRSVAVIDSSDAFATRLLNGMTSILPDDRNCPRAFTPKIGSYSGLQSHFESALSGPKSASDVGDWQNWLDAVLLMLFDEDEEGALSEDVSEFGTDIEAVKSRVKQLAQSGLKHEVLQKLSLADKRSVFEKIQKQASTDKQSSFASLQTDLARSLQNDILQCAKVSKLSDKVSQIGNFSISPALRQISSISEDLTRSSRTLSQRKKWSEAVRSFVENHGASQAHDKVLLKNMSDVATALVQDGVLAPSILDSVQNFEVQYTKSLQQQNSIEISKPSIEFHSSVSNLEGLVSKLAEKLFQPPQLSTFRALKPVVSAGSHLGGSSVVFASLAEKLDAISESVEKKIASAGDNATTLKWKTAVERYQQLGGVYEDTDKVLLRDIAEAATELSKMGVLADVPEFGFASKNSSVPATSVPTVEAKPLASSKVFEQVEQAMTRAYQMIRPTISQATPSTLVDHFDSFGESLTKFATQRGHSDAQDIALLNNVSEKFQGFLNLADPSFQFVQAKEEEIARPASQSLDTTESIAETIPNSGYVQLEKLARELQNLRNNGYSLSSAQWREFAKNLSENSLGFVPVTSVVMDDHLIDGKYFKSLGSNLQTLQRITSPASIAKLQDTSGYERIESRLSRMLDLVSVPTEATVAGSRNFSFSDEVEFSHVSLNEVTPDSQKLQQMQAASEYASQAQFKDQLISMFGAEKAVLKHANDLIANASQFDANAFASALSQSLLLDASKKYSPKTSAGGLDSSSNVVRENASNGLASLLQTGKTSLKLSQSGLRADTLKVDLSLVKQAYDELSLKTQMGKSHLPARFREIADTPAIAAHLELVSPAMDLGTTDFIPIAFGTAHRAELAAENASDFRTNAEKYQTHKEASVEVDARLLDGRIQGNASGIRTSVEGYSEESRSVVDRMLPQASLAASKDVTRASEAGLGSLPAQKAAIRGEKLVSALSEGVIGEQSRLTSVPYDAETLEEGRTFVSQVSSDMRLASAQAERFESAAQRSDSYSVHFAEPSGIRSYSSNLGNMFKQTRNTTDNSLVALHFAPNTLLHAAADSFSRSGSISDLSSAYSLIDRQFLSSVASSTSTGIQSRWSKNISSVRNLYRQKFAEIELASNFQQKAKGIAANRSDGFKQEFGSLPALESLLIRGYPVLKKLSELDSLESQSSAIRQYSTKTSSSERFVPVGTTFATMGFAPEPNDSVEVSKLFAETKRKVASVAHNSVYSDNHYALSQSYSQSVASNASEWAQVKPSATNTNYLGSIDSMLDHVERVYDRGSEVLSNASVQMVLYASSSASNVAQEQQGLPSWRQRSKTATWEGIDTNELHSMLQKVGAVPIQGMQPSNDRKFVNPFLSLSELSKSGNSNEDDSTSKTQTATSAAAKGMTTTKIVQTQPTHEDIVNIAEEVYFKILDSLSEELQRRRFE